MKAGIDYIGVGVGALVTRSGKRGTELLLLRHGLVCADGSSWTIPGGEMEFGETPEAAVARELKEETQLLLLRAALLDVVTLAGSDRHWVSIVFSVSRYDGTPKVGEPQQFDAIKWFRINDLPRLNPISAVTIAKTLSRLRGEND